MPRRPQIDYEEIIDRAMHLFWQRGYKKTSVEDLINEAGINRFNLYETFGGKQGLYLKALDKYRDEVFLQRMKKIDDHKNGLQGIRDYFESLEKFLIDSKGDFTCLMMNSQIELVPKNKKVSEKVSFYFKKMEQTFYNALSRAKKESKLSNNSDLRDLAKFLTGSAQGMCVMSKSADSVEFLRAYTKTIIKTLEQHAQ